MGRWYDHTAGHSIAQHSTAQHSTAQHSTAGAMPHAVTKHARYPWCLHRPLLQLPAHLPPRYLSVDRVPHHSISAFHAHIHSASFHIHIHQQNRKGQEGIMQQGRIKQAKLESTGRCSLFHAERHSLFLCLMLSHPQGKPNILRS